MSGLLLAVIVMAVTFALFAVWRLQSDPYDAVDEWHEQMRALGDAASSDDSGPQRGQRSESPREQDSARGSLRRTLPRLIRRGVSPFVP